MPWLLLGTLLLCRLNSQASTLTVSSTADSGAGTLRAQIAAAAPGDTINFSVTGTITLTSGVLAIAQNLTIAGPGASSLTVSGAGDSESSIFAIISGLVSLSGLSLANGTGTLGSGGGLGGAIYMTGGTVTVTGSAFFRNAAAGGHGGAIYIAGGFMAITSSTFTNNTCGAYGGAIDVAGGSLAVTNSIFTGNSTLYGEGGAISIENGSLALTDSTISKDSAGDGGGLSCGGGTMTIRDSTISGNTAQYNSGASGIGGGILCGGGTTTIVNSTISGNQSFTSTSSGGGGIYNHSTLTIANSTITLNSAIYGGGILQYGNLNMSNCIVANNVAASGPDIYSIVNAGDYNLVQNLANATLSGSHNVTGQPALLGPLTNNGGLTQTHTPLPGSPAIEAGDPNFNATGIPYDQRGPGFPRVLNGRLSIGADELEPNQSGSNFVVNSLTDHDYGVCSPTDGSLREAINYSPAGATITFSVTGTITLTLGDLLINKNLSITGPASAPGITVSGNYASRIFTLTNGASLLNLSTLTLSGGNGAGSLNSGIGGAINIGSFTPPLIVNVTNCTLSGNTTATSNGGAIRNGGILTLTGSTFSGNSATGNGGALNLSSGTVNLYNTIVAGNSAPTGADINGTVAAGDYDLVQNPTNATLPGSHNITGQPALLGPLAYYGGPSPTLALLPGSPAIDAGSTPLTTDQRGVARPQGAAADIGAFELGPIFPPTLAIQALPPSQVGISWYTVTNAAYQLQYCSDLTTNQWTSLSAWMVGGGQLISTNDSVLAGGPPRFYRVGVTNSP